MRPLLVWRGYWIDEGYVMSGFKGTPGPWEVDEYGRLIDASGMTIAARGMANEMVAVANSKLVSASPELLEALEEAVKDLLAYQINARHAAKINARWEGCAEAVQPSIDKAREAINKALGR